MRRRLIVTADDFGMSLEVNEAVEEGHRNGILTCASLVTAYGAPSQAPPREIAGLLDPSGKWLGERPVATGARLSLSSSLQTQVRAEVGAQFEAFARSGLRLDHVDGHWHCHQHPYVLRTLMEMGAPRGLAAVRIPYEPPLPSWRAAGRRQLVRRAVNAMAHRPLAANMRRHLRARGVAFNDWFFGKVDEGAMTASHMQQLFTHLPPGVSELGLHPATATWPSEHAPPAHWRAAEELAALVDPAVRAACRREGIELIRFGDLSAC